MIKNCLLLAVFAVCWLYRVPVLGQSGEQLLQQARAARDERAFARATELTRRYLEQEPADAGARWLLGQLLYWQHDVRAAMHEYGRALALRPEDASLRIDFARMLYELQLFHSSARVLEPIAESANPEVLSLRRQLRAALTSWVIVAVRFDDDDQPRQNLALEIEHIQLLSDEISARAWVIPRMIRNPEGSLRDTRVDALVGFSWRAPRVGLAMSVGASGDAGEWKPIGSAQLALPVAKGVELNAIARRTPYESTLASLDSVLLVTSLDAGLDAGTRPRWAGVARVHLDWFEDANTIVSTYGWLLVPVATWLRVGYAASWQDSRESRWTRNPRGAPQALGPGRADTIPGRYAPYYTPDAVITHSALVAMELRTGRSQLRVRSALPIYAREQAPVLLGGIGQNAVLATFPRRNHPWTVAAGWSRSVSPALQWSIDAEYERKTYYRIGRVGITATWRPGANGS